jgi:hypothetical protein
MNNTIVAARDCHARCLSPTSRLIHCHIVAGPRVDVHYGAIVIRRRTLRYNARVRRGARRAISGIRVLSRGGSGRQRGSRNADQKVLASHVVTPCEKLNTLRILGFCLRSDNRWGIFRKGKMQHLRASFMPQVLRLPF